MKRPLVVAAIVGMVVLALAQGRIREEVQLRQAEARADDRQRALLLEIRGLVDAPDSLRSWDPAYVQRIRRLHAHAESLLVVQGWRSPDSPSVSNRR